MTESCAFFIVFGGRNRRYGALFGSSRQMSHAAEAAYPLTPVRGRSHRKYRVGKQTVIGGKYFKLAIFESGQTIVGSDPQCS